MTNQSNVTNPKHYNSHPSGVEAIKILRHFPANIYAAMKYLWRQEHKNGVEDMKKSIWHIADQIDLVEGNSDNTNAWGERLKAAMKEISK